MLREGIVDRERCYLVWWAGYPKSEATWESAAGLEAQVGEAVRAFKNK